GRGEGAGTGDGARDGARGGAGGVGGAGAAVGAEPRFGALLAQRRGAGDRGAHGVSGDGGGEGWDDSRGAVQRMIADFGLRIADSMLGLPLPNPQSAIDNPQSIWSAPSLSS